MSSKPQPITVKTPEENQLAYEEANVHQVYQIIASHFSNTRYKPWPVVENFLNSMAPGSLGADVGCGNGKYIGVNKNVYIVGSDRCANLIKIVNDKGCEGLVADALNLPYRDGTFDFAISIAVIHHFASPERRLQAIEDLFKIVRPGGKVLVFVWALEQTKFSKRNFQADQQDVFVPWKLTKPANNDRNETQAEAPVYNRYYHLFKKGELDDLFNKVEGVAIESSGYDRDNHYVIGYKL
ncbi:S-adenosyl-L-methionine-dependent methyltransferase [Pilobolus umbonatus]|nr:S-adenosyl-L-methionine-dependent methyltransferase [Pilobolus umbonatus]